MKIDPEKFYQLIAPRLTAAITTFNSLKAINACVVSFISPVSFRPPILMISLAPVRHSYENISQTNEFVVNVLGKEHIDQLLMCGRRYQKGVNKLQQAGLRWYSSKLVKPPRIKEAKVWIECKVREEKRMGDHVAIFGEVLAAEAKDEVVTNGGILGKITKVSDNFVAIAIAENVEISIQKSAITMSVPKGTIKSA